MLALEGTVLWMFLYTSSLPIITVAFFTLYVVCKHSWGHWLKQPLYFFSLKIAVNRQFENFKSQRSRRSIEWNRQLNHSSNANDQLKHNRDSIEYLLKWFFRFYTLLQPIVGGPRLFFMQKNPPISMVLTPSPLKHPELKLNLEIEHFNKHQQYGKMTSASTLENVNKILKWMWVFGLVRQIS